MSLKKKIMEQNHHNEKQLRMEHEWTQRHVAAYLQDGMAYTIILNDNTRIEDAVFHHCALLGNHYFARGASVYPIEKIYSHSMKGHIAPEVTGTADSHQTPPDPDRLVITGEEGEVIKVITTPDINPEIFRRRVKSQMISGLSREQAEHIVSTEPMELELFYDVGLGAFAIDAGAVGNTPLYNPYTGKEIPEEI